MDFLRNSNPPYLQAHCQSPTSQRYNHSFGKELAKPAQEKNFKIFLPRLKEKKIKTRQSAKVGQAHGRP